MAPARRPPRPAGPLTPRQTLVTALVVAHGHKETAHILGRSVSTIRQTMRRARARVGADNNLELAFIGGRDGWLAVPNVDTFDR